MIRPKVLALLGLTALCSFSSQASPNIQVGFSPEGSAQALVLSTINHAQKSINLSGYNFSAADIASALSRAAKRGVEVKLILDEKSNRNRYSQAAMNLVVNAGGSVRTTSNYKIHHDKVIIVDDITVETGSFNFTKAAEYTNSENVVVMQDLPDVAKVYLSHWRSRWDTGTNWQSTY